MTETEFIRLCIGWDVLNWSKAVKFWKERLQSNPNSRILELGSGPGGISLWLASMDHEVVCSDLNEPGEDVKSFHRKYHHSGNISYQAVNATDIPFENEFDFVVFRSVLGGASSDGNDANKELVMEGIRKALKPGGMLLFAENLQASPLHMLFRKTFVRWGRSWNYSSKKEMLQLLAVFDDVNFSTNGFVGSFGRSERQRKFLSYFDVALFDHLMPSSWHYIMYGSAGKGR
jgi:SAM-dependent methyltransferase